MFSLSRVLESRRPYNCKRWKWQGLDPPSDCRPVDLENSNFSILELQSSLNFSELTDKTALALVGKSVQFDFTIPGVASETAVDITWKWNGLSGNVNEQGE